MRKRTTFPVCAILCCTALSPLAATVRAQASATASSATDPVQTSAAPAAPLQNGSPGTPPGKHVWTNEDVAQLHGQAEISTVGANAKSSKPATVTKPRPKAAAYYHDQIARLQGQVPAIDQQIATLQDALSGKIIDETRKYPGVKLDDWHSELAALQKKRTDILEQIATLEDQARHDGIPANALP